MTTSSISASTPKKSVLDIYSRAGDELCTIFVPAPSAIEDAEQQLSIRTKNVDSVLEAAGVVESLRSSIAEVLTTAGHGVGASLAIVADESGPIFVEALERPVAEVHVSVTEVPTLLPLLAARQIDTPHLAVLLDRTGADLFSRDDVGAPDEEITIDGPDVRVHRSHPGGWSQRRFQQTAENAWENNAKAVVDEMLDQYPGVELVICAGDERAVGFFDQHLPERIEVITVDGSRHADTAAFLDEADRALRDLAAREQVLALEEWRSLAAKGLGETGWSVLNRLTEGRVDTLYVVDDTDAERETARFDFEANVHLHDSERGVVVPATDGAVALAVAYGADVVVVPATADIEHGLAATLRG